jgi:hypothetical protein
MVRIAPADPHFRRFEPGQDPVRMLPHVDIVLASMVCCLEDTAR